MDHLNYFCLVFVMLTCFCLLMPDHACGHLLGKGDLLALVCDVLLRSCHFPIGILCQMWCLIVSIPELCPLFHFYNKNGDFWSI